MARAAAALLLAGALALPAGAADPYASYRDAHPDVGVEDLLEVERGDSLERVLAVLHNPDASFAPTAVRLFEAGGLGAAEVALETVLRAGESAPTLVAAVAQRCTEARPGAGGPPFTSWFLLEAGVLRVWALQPFGPDCSRQDSLVDASDHEAMRQVGRALFARARRGSFHYGPLAYEEWNEAFASPTPEGMLSRLQATARERPHDARAQNRLAVGHYALGERKAAVAALERAIRLASSWPVPHRNLAVSYRQQGDLVAAAEARERADWLSRAGP